MGAKGIFQAAKGFDPHRRTRKRASRRLPLEGYREAEMKVLRETRAQQMKALLTKAALRMRDLPAAPWVRKTRALRCRRICCPRFGEPALRPRAPARLKPPQMRFYPAYRSAALPFRSFAAQRNFPRFAAAFANFVDRRFAEFSVCTTHRPHYPRFVRQSDFRRRCFSDSVPN